MYEAVARLIGASDDEVSAADIRGKGAEDAIGREYHARNHHKIVGVPYVYWTGTEGGYNILVMELLGPSLEALFSSCGRKLSLKTALMVADQMVSHHLTSLGLSR